MKFQNTPATRRAFLVLSLLPVGVAMVPCVATFFTTTAIMSSWLAAAVILLGLLSLTRTLIHLYKDSKEPLLSIKRTLRENKDIALIATVAMPVLLGAFCGINLLPVLGTVALVVAIFASLGILAKQYLNKGLHAAINKYNVDDDDNDNEAMYDKLQHKYLNSYKAIAVIFNIGIASYLACSAYFLLTSSEVAAPVMGVLSSTALPIVIVFLAATVLLPLLINEVCEHRVEKQLASVMDPIFTSVFAFLPENALKYTFRVVRDNVSTL